MFDTDVFVLGGGPAGLAAAIATRMAGPGAPGSLAEGVDTQFWLATSDAPAVQVSGRLFHERREQRAHAAARDPSIQDELLRVCARATGVAPPPAPRRSSSTPI